MASASLGNYFTGAGLGLYGEVGWNLVDALGGTALRQGFNAASTVGVGPVEGWSVSLSGGFMGYGVAHYLPLDGTVFSDSRSVDSKPFIGMATLGIAVRHRGFVFFLGKNVLHQDIRHRAAAPRVRNFELVLVFLKVSTASPRHDSHRGPSATASGCPPARRFSTGRTCSSWSSTFRTPSPLRNCAIWRAPSHCVALTKSRRKGDGSLTTSCGAFTKVLSLIQTLTTDAFTRLRYLDASADKA